MPSISQYVSTPLGSVKMRRNSPPITSAQSLVAHHSSLSEIIYWEWGRGNGRRVLTVVEWNFAYP